MPEPIDLTSSAMVALSRSSIGSLRASLLRDAGPASASYFQEAGFAGGPAVFEAFRGWLAGRGHEAPESLEVSEFTALASDFFRETGWGSVQLGTLGAGLATIDSPNWSESDPSAALEHPGCHLSTGTFADFFGRMADAPLAVLEVECRSAGASRCRFLLGSAETMQALYDRMAQGESYAEAAEALG